MPRPRTKIELTLFPFMSVLCGLIAVLILMIINILQSGTADASSASGAMLKQSAQRGPSAKEEQELERRKEQLNREIPTKQAKLQELQERLRQLKLVLELRKRQELVEAAGSTTVGEPIGAPVPKRYRMVPTRGGGDLTKTVVLVEITASKYLVHVGDGGLKEEYNAMKSNPKGPDPKPDRELARFLDSVDQQRRDRYLLLLIHEDGIESYKTLRSYCEASFPVIGSKKLASNPDQATFDLGVEPFSNDWLMLGAAEE